MSQENVELVRRVFTLWNRASAGDRRVLAAYRIRAHGRSSGAPVERDSFHVYTFRGGRIASVEIFGTRSEALEAAGLRE